MFKYLALAYTIVNTVFGQTVVQVINSNPQLSTLAGAIKAAGLESTLNSTSANFTVLAPTNEAFTRVKVPSQTSVLANLLEYHVVSGKVLSTDLSSGLVVKTLQMQTVTVLERGNNVDFIDSNGRPANVVKANINAINGEVHIINDVLLPNGTIANITANIPDLSDLNGALVKTGLNKVLADPTQTLTLFAPNNQAVEAFKGTINENLLLYHALGSEVYSTDLKKGDNVVPSIDANKDDIDVIVENDGVRIKDVNNRTGTVEVVNIAGVNGVVHLINIVLSPVPVKN